MLDTNHHNPTETLKELLLQTAQGDQFAFGRLFHLYWNKIYVQALTYLKSPEMAREATQDVFVKLWQVREQLPELDNFEDFVFIISRNHIISKLRKKLSEPSGLQQKAEEDVFIPDQQLQYKELYNHLMQSIEKLPPVRKKVFMLSRIDGLSYDQIAESLSISRNTVKDHLVKALNFLRNQLDENQWLILLVLAAAI